MKKKERRKGPRHTAEGITGRMVLASQVDIENLSLGGVSLRVDRRLNIGSEYTLKLELENRSLSVTGVVVWSKVTGFRQRGDESLPEYSAGLMFTDVLTDKLKGLIHFIDDHKVSEEHRLGGLRFQISTPGKAVLDAPDSYRIRLISLSGMLIETQQDLQPENVCEMEICPPEQPPIKLLGRVASSLEVQEAESEHYEVGIEFLELSPENRRRLESLIAAIAR